MFKCCICGKQYISKDAAVKCVNKCARQCFASGKFQKKEAHYSPDVENFICEVPLPAHSDDLEDEVNRVCIELIDGGAPEKEINLQRTRIFATWNEKSKGDKMKDLQRLYLLKNFYS